MDAVNGGPATVGEQVDPEDPVPAPPEPAAEDARDDAPADGLAVGCVPVGTAFLSGPAVAEVPPDADAPGLGDEPHAAAPNAKRMRTPDAS
jgi:hypothetical protein